MNEEKTTKVGRTVCGTDVACASPAGHEELEEQAAAEIKGDGEVPPDRDRHRNPPVHSVEPQNRNAKHVGRAPRT